MGEPECVWDYETTASLGAPRIRNRESGQRPLVAHGCGGHGRWFLADVYRELRLLEYLGIRGEELAGIKFAGLVAPGKRVTEEQWVDQPPWDFPFQLFQMIRSMTLERERASRVGGGGCGGGGGGGGG